MMTAYLQLGPYNFPLGKRTLIMGILNVTPDSFSDGGRYNRIDKAIAQAQRMAEEGADIIDVGGESTRPGYDPISTEEELGRVIPALLRPGLFPAFPISTEEELGRVIPVIRALQKEVDLPISIDTYKSEIAAEALHEGAHMVNDIWGLKADRRMAAVVAAAGVPLCLMHNRKEAVYRDLISDIISDLQESIDLAIAAGVKENNIIIDPGIGFGKTLDHNLEVMHHLHELKTMGFPVLLGTSRKSMIGKTLNLPVEDRLEGTAASVACGITAGVDIIRVHDVKEMYRVAAMADAIVRRWKG